MGEHSQESLSVIERTPWARYAFVVLLVVIGTVTLRMTWDEAAASTSVLHHRIFLIGAALVWAVVAVTLALVPWWQETRAWLIAVHLVIMGLYLGLAIATTNWTALQMRGWWQLWWAYPLMAGQIGQVLKLLRFGPNPLARSLRLVRNHPLPAAGGSHP